MRFGSLFQAYENQRRTYDGNDILTSGRSQQSTIAGTLRTIFSVRNSEVSARRELTVFSCNLEFLKICFYNFANVFTSISLEVKTAASIFTRMKIKTCRASKTEIYVIHQLEINYVNP